MSPQATKVCDAWPVRHRTYGYLPSRRVPLIQFGLLCRHVGFSQRRSPGLCLHAFIQSRRLNGLYRIISFERIVD